MTVVQAYGPRLETWGKLPHKVRKPLDEARAYVERMKELGRPVKELRLWAQDYDYIADFVRKTTAKKLDIGLVTYMERHFIRGTERA